MSTSTSEASIRKDAFKEKAKEFLEMYGDLPTEEKQLLLYEAFGKSDDFIKNVQVAIHRTSYSRAS